MLAAPVRSLHEWRTEQGVELYLSAIFTGILDPPASGAEVVKTPRSKTDRKEHCLERGRPGNLRREGLKALKDEGTTRLVPTHHVRHADSNPPFLSHAIRLNEHDGTFCNPGRFTQVRFHSRSLAHLVPPRAEERGGCCSPNAAAVA